MNFKKLTHDGILFSCCGEYEFLGLPSILWKPSLSMKTLSNENGDYCGEFVPYAMQFIRCTSCRSIDTVYFVPDGSKIGIEAGQRFNLPLHMDCDWAFFNTPIEVKSEYYKARVNCRDPYKYSDSLVECRRALEIITYDLEKNTDKQKIGISLNERINSLCRNGLLASNLCKIAHGIRRFSNIGAHTSGWILPSNEPGVHGFPLEEETIITIFHMETLISHLYIIPALEERKSPKTEWKAAIHWIQNSPCGELQ